MNGFSLIDFKLPIINDDKSIMDWTLMSDNFESKIDEDTIINENNRKIQTLTKIQSHIFNNIINSIDNQNAKKCYFIDGPGGTGKTHLLNTLIGYFMEHQVSFLSVAYTGIAANLLINGRTVHTTFKLPLTIKNKQHAMCIITQKMEKK